MNTGIYKKGSVHGHWKVGMPLTAQSGVGDEKDT